jgi:hypothetical protein
MANNRNEHMDEEFVHLHEEFVQLHEESYLALVLGVLVLLLFLRS